MEELSISINNIWVLVATFLVMFMQPGFAMVEAGFTRTKNTANILDQKPDGFFYWLYPVLVYWVHIMYGDSIWGFIGIPDPVF
jgi:ammonium transporter, Amt family